MKAKIAQLLVEYFFDLVVEPLVDYIIDKGLFTYDKAQGKLKLTHIKNAKNSKNKDRYWDEMSDV